LNTPSDKTSDKKSLRAYMKAQRRERATVEGGERAAENLLALPEIQSAKSVFLYAAFGSELPTEPAIERLTALQKEVYLPRMENSGMVPVFYKKGIPMPENQYGIKEPIGVGFYGIPDAVVLPLLAVDTSGNRLGYGGGYYDQYLQGKTTFKVAYCYDFQVLDEVFSELHDVKVNAIVTDKRVIYIQ
jgi:5-formyltetrahydrofolate cyclo-ligase